MEHIAEDVVQVCKDLVDQISDAPDRRVVILLYRVSYIDVTFLLPFRSIRRELNRSLLSSSLLLLAFSNSIAYYKRKF